MSKRKLKSPASNANNSFNQNLTLKSLFSGTSNSNVKSPKLDTANENMLEFNHDTTECTSNPGLHETKLIPSIRVHKGQTFGVGKPAVTINCSNIDYFKHQCWEHFQIYLKREVVYDPETDVMAAITSVSGS
jgi:hypothetical protein